MPKNNDSTSSEKVSIDELKEEAKKLVKKIQDHFVAIEEHRKKDRDLWRSLNRRLESLEEVKGESVALEEAGRVNKHEERTKKKK